MPRAGTRPLVSNTVRVCQSGSGRNTLLFRFSFDIVEKLLRKRDGVGSVLNSRSWPGLRMEFMAFSDKSIPAVFVRIAKPSYDPRDPRLTKAAHGHTFRTVVKASRVGVKDDIPAQRLKLLWIDTPPGLLLVFPDDQMLSPIGKLDPEVAFK
jgi:hypothetical protein